jgi:hypothetical protein
MDNLFILVLYMLGTFAALLVASGLVLLWAVWRDRYPRPMAVRRFKTIRMWNL